MQIPDEHDAESLADQRIRELLERYVSLVGGSVREVEPHLLELDLPPRERRFFGRSEQLGRGQELVKVVFSLDTLERHPDADMAVVGSDFFDRLITAIQARGHRIVRGIIPPSDAADGESAMGHPPWLCTVMRRSRKAPAGSVRSSPFQAWEAIFRNSRSCVSRSRPRGRSARSGAVVAQDLKGIPFKPIPAP